MITSVCAIASLISVSFQASSLISVSLTLSPILSQILAFGDSLIYVAFYFCLGRRKCPTSLKVSEITNGKAVYSNSVLVTLNARKMIRRVGDDSDFSFQTLSGTGRRNNVAAMVSCILPCFKLEI